MSHFGSYRVVVEECLVPGRLVAIIRWHVDGLCEIATALLGGTNKIASYFEVEIPVFFHRKFRLDKEAYVANHPPQPQRETRQERTIRFQRLMDENGWSRSELARQLVIRRAWVTKVLKGEWRSAAKFVDESGEGH